jgi:DNA-binding NtrC family response regulator
MASVLLIGTNDAILEGVAQALAANGHRPLSAQTMAEASELATEHRPVVTLVDRAAASTAEFTSIHFPPGCVLVLYREHGDNRPLPPTSVQRMTVAELELPLERQRLLALVQFFSDRARTTGRLRPDTPPDEHPRIT